MDDAIQGMKPRRNFALLALGISTLSIVAPCHAGDADGTLAITWENDTFRDTDRNYTNGLRIAYVSGALDTSTRTARFATSILGQPADADILRGIAVGQSIFTPRDISAESPLPGQHPYAGWLYGEYSVISKTSDTFQRFTVTLGLAGPSAGGEWVQNNVHRLIGAPKARGWRNQLDDEPGLIVSYDKQFRSFHKTVFDSGLAVDFTPSLGASVGNIYTHAKAGAVVRIGAGLRSDFGPPRIRPSLSGSGHFRAGSGDSWYLFTGAEARLTAHNFFIEGSILGGMQTELSQEDLVWDFQSGLVVQRGDVQLSFTYVRRSQEFKQQPDPQEFGAISVSSRF